jgi:ABC-type amino acid transport substrate-binding protein
MRRAVGLLILCCALFAPPASAQQYLPGIADLIANDELKVGMLAWDVPPMIVTGEDGTAGCYDVRIAEAIAQTLGVRLSIVRTEKTANAIIEQVARGDVDIAVSYLSRTPTRALKVLFTRPYLEQNHTLLLSRAFVAQQGGGCPNAEAFLEEALQTPVGIVGESAYVERVLHAQPNANIIRFDTFDEMMQALRSGAVAQSFQGEITVHRSLADHPAMRVFAQLCEFPSWPDNVSMAVNGQRAELVSFLNVFLDHVVLSVDEAATSLTIDPWYNE